MGLDPDTILHIKPDGTLVEERQVMDDVLFLDANVLVSAAWKDLTQGCSNSGRWKMCVLVYLRITQLTETERSLLSIEEQLDRFRRYFCDSPYE